MADIKFINQPGYLYDLLSIFALSLNKNLHGRYYFKNDKDIDSFNEILSKFPDISNNLLIFFYIKENSTSFLISNYFCNIEDRLLTDYNFNALRTELQDVDRFKKALFNYYFPGKEDYNDDINEISKLIDEASFSDNIKHRLLAFFINPESNIQQLICELTEKDVLLSKYREDNYMIGLNIQEHFNLDEYKNLMRKCTNNSTYMEEDVDRYFSFCYVAKNTVINIDQLIILGIDYEDALKSLLENNAKPELDMLGKVLSEKNRVEILEMLYNADEISTSDIAKTLNLSVNSAFYHLNMMYKADMIKMRNQGRTVFYRLNKQYFINAGNAISKYSKSNIKE